MKTHSDDNSRTTTVEAPGNIPQDASLETGWLDERAELSGAARWRLPLLVCIVLMGIIGFAARTLSKKSAASAVQKEPPVVDVIPFRPTPEPVQPTPTPPPIIDVFHPPDPPEVAPDPVTPPDGTAILGKVSNGPLVFDPTRKPVVLIKPHGDRKRHPEWDAYASVVNARIRAALQSDSRTQKMNGDIIIRVWPDAIGRITRSELETPTGDSRIDAVIREEILQGLQIAQPPPSGMPPYIRLKVTARRPN